jgi:tryptophan synthase beta chain
MGVDTAAHAARFGNPDVSRPGILHGTRSYVMQNEDGQVIETHSISAGLDYPSIGPEHAYLRSMERAFYTSATDEETLAAFRTLSEMEGIIPALESAHAVAEVIKRAPTMRPDQIILLNLSGRGDKDLDTVIRALDEER